MQTLAICPKKRMHRGPLNSARGTASTSNQQLALASAYGDVSMFTQGLVADLILSPQLGPYHLCLVDIDPYALAVAVGLSRKLVEAKGADLTGQPAGPKPSLNHPLDNIDQRRRAILAGPAL